MINKNRELRGGEYRIEITEYRRQNTEFRIRALETWMGRKAGTQAGPWELDKGVGLRSKSFCILYSVCCILFKSPAWGQERLFL